MSTRFVCRYDQLTAALRAASVLVEPGSGIAERAGVALIGANGEFTVNSSAAGPAVSVRVSAEQAVGELLVPHEELLKLLGAITSGRSDAERAALMVTIEEPERERALLTLDGITVPLTSSPLANARTVPHDLPLVAEVDGATFVEGLRRVLPAAERDRINQRLNGVWLELAANQITLRTCDRYRMAIAPICGQVMAPELVGIGALLDLNVARHVVSKLAGKRVGICLREDKYGNSLSLSDGVVTFVAGNAGNEFVAFDRFLNKPVTTRVRVARMSLLQAVDTVAKIATAKAENHRRRRLIVTGAGVTIGAETTVATVSGEAREREIEVNVEHLLAALKLFSSEQVTLHIADSGSVTLLTESERIASEREYVHILSTSISRSAAK